MFSTFLSIYQGLELLDLVMTLSHFEDLLNCFPQQLNHFTIPLTTYEGSNFSTSSPALVLVCIFIIAILVGVECFFIVVLSCNSLTANDVEYLFCVLIGLFKEMFIQIVPIFELLSCTNSLYILDTIPYPDTWFADSLSCQGFRFHFLDAQKF